MSGTMSSSNSEWVQFYQNNNLSTAATRWSGDVVTDSTTVVTTTTSNNNIANQLGRVSRPTAPRRRSRASRRTPTTLLNTDTTNFRAMVQRFTGGGGCGSVGGGGSNGSANSTTTHPFLSFCNDSNNFNYGLGGSTSSVVEPLPQFRQPHGGQQYNMLPANGSRAFIQRVQDYSLEARQGNDANSPNENGVANNYMF